LIKAEQLNKRKISKKIKTKATKVASPSDDSMSKNHHHSVNYELTQDSGGNFIAFIVLIYLFVL